MPDRPARLRAFYARYVTLCAGAADQRVAAAFAAVKRENFVGPAPWFLPGGPDAVSPFALGYFETPDGDLAWLYQDVLVALDPARGINNGQPSLHARCIDALGVQAGETVLHVGAGTGYYTAILGALASAVHAFELDPELAARAAANLSGVANVTLHAISGIGADLPKADAIYVNAAATHPLAAWLDALRPGGRLLFPLQPSGGFGGMLLITRPQDGLAWPARFICRAGFIPCGGGQDEAAGAALGKAFAGEGWRHVSWLHRDTAPDETCWVQGEGWWLGM